MGSTFNLEEAIKAKNEKLDFVTIRAKNNSSCLYLRATLPNPDGTKKKREISTGAKASKEGLKIASH
ncbi:hypothetical protein [Gloeothece verrucosa]|uniref:hypothetical protein n=1 Tax=Gloeothece verrucosa TaxID=2546359 RepID=UPI0003012DB8|nr:hypothetical protein [Gloeothece verrucosa]